MGSPERENESELAGEELNGSYADQTGHQRRGIYKEVTRFFRGMPPKCIGTIHFQDNKRKMKRIPPSGKK